MLQSDANIELDRLTARLCDYEEISTAIVPWWEMVWQVSGDSVSQVQVEAETVCSQSDVHSVLLPALLTFDEALAACDKLGEAALREPREPGHLANLSSWYGPSVLSCQHVWTPYSDHRQEGVFVNQNTGQIIRQVMGYSR